APPSTTFYTLSLHDALPIYFPTIVLLFSMMLIVSNLHLVGFFEWSAEAVLNRLPPHYLLPAIIFTCGILSAFFVNDIVCLVMVRSEERRVGKEGGVGRGVLA